MWSGGIVLIVQQTAARLGLHSCSNCHKNNVIGCEFHMIDKFEYYATWKSCHANGQFFFMTQREMCGSVRMSRLISSSYHLKLARFTHRGRLLCRLCGKTTLSTTSIYRLLSCNGNVFRIPISYALFIMAFYSHSSLNLCNHFKC